MAPDELHPTLQRQLRRCGLDHQRPPAATPDWEAFLQRVSQCYRDSDADRYTMERSIDVSSQEMAELHESLAQREQFQRAVLEHAAEGIVTIDADGVIVSFNAAAERIFGWDSEEMVGRELSELMPLELRAAHRAGLERRARGERARILGRTIEMEGVRRSGERFPMDLSVAEVRVGARRTYVGVMRDISERKQLEAALFRQATQDALTGLANRSVVLEALRAALGDGPSPRIVGVLFVDLDRFKIVNDSLGHGAGDALLVEVSRRLRACVRAEDLVGRLGGDEFVVVCHGGDEDDIRQVADRVLATLASPFELNGHRVYVGASVGVAFAGADATADDLLHSADLAMYAAKSGGRNRVSCFEQQLKEQAEERLASEAALRTALEHDELCAYFQPVVDLVTGAAVGAEALVRWRRPDGTIVTPAGFLPIAEETGLMVDVGAVVLDQACREVSRWSQLWPDRRLRVSVNLSARELRHEHLIDRVADALDRYALDPRLLVLEVTEVSMIADDAVTRGAMHGLLGLGVSIAIDDFGTGWSSLSYLRRLPASTLKIDRSFIVDVDSDPRSGAIVGAIVKMGEACGMSAVVEGIERPSQAEALAALGARFAQGYLFAHPQDAKLVIGTFARLTAGANSSNRERRAG